MGRMFRTALAPIISALAITKSIESVGLSSENKAINIIPFIDVFIYQFILHATLTILFY